MKLSIFIIPLLFLFVGLRAQNTPKITMADFMGVNSNVASFDNKYLADLSKCVKWMREYHDWSHYEAANNYYKWDNITTQPQGYTWPEHTDFMKECRRLGINVLIDVLGKPSWTSTSPIPVSSGTGTNAADYMERLEFLGQLVARYGSKKIAANLLETADKATGLNMIKYYEDDNEPDYTWKSPLWTAANYAKYCNAAHDGFGVHTDPDHPLLGIKSVDPGAIHVMAGLASKDTVYVNNVMKASAGRVPFDVLNVHWYCSDLKNAYSPENEKYGYEIAYRNFFKWKKRVLPNMPIWITEFGWDTYLSATKQHSYTYAPENQQANYLLRSYLILLKMGFEKAFLFMDTDVDSKNILQYSASGLLSDRDSKYIKKPSYYYLATMQKVLGNADFSNANVYQEILGANEVYCIEFTNPTNSDNVFAIWTRKKGSSIDDGTKTSYRLNPGHSASYVYSIVPADKDMDGDTIVPTLTDGAINLSLTETPQFVVVAVNNTGSDHITSPEFEMNVFPNPSSKEVQIALSVDNQQDVNISAFNTDGKLIETLHHGKIEPGLHQYSFGKNIQAGTYLLCAKSATSTAFRKVVLID